VKTIKARAIGLFIAGMALALSNPASAEDYPSRSIRLIVPTVPGGGTDFTARYVANRLGKSLGQAVVVENRSGADGIIGANVAAKSAPDGYTLVLPITSFPIDPSLYAKLPFDTVKDFAAIILVSKAPLLLVVNPSVPVKTVAELIAYAKEHPRKLHFGHSGPGTSSNLASELLKRETGIDIVAVGYKGGGQIVTDLLAGQIEIYIGTVASTLELVKAGKLRALAVTTASRVPETPDTPTMAESGVKDFDVSGWFGLFAPAGTPKPVISRLNAEIGKILADPETARAFAAEGLTVGGGSPEALATFLKADIARWSEVVSAAHIKIE
jgi:tripartite-type tricarboxylate transporter receptor subunit TctC